MAPYQKLETGCASTLYWHQSNHIALEQMRVEVALVRQLDKNDKRFLRDLEAMPARHIFISRTE